MVGPPPLNVLNMRWDSNFNLWLYESSGHQPFKRDTSCKERREALDDEFSNPGRNLDKNQMIMSSCG